MRNISGFLSSESGSFAPAFAITLVPVLLAMGIAVDYTSATTDRAQMQNALDSAILSITTMARTATDGERQKTLQDVYAANGGPGTARLHSVSFDADGTMHASTSATYAMPTDFMALAKINSVDIRVATAVRKNPALVEATFQIDKASGYWDKTITLFGTDPSKPDADPLMKIDYKYNGKGGSKGYGTTTVYTKDTDGNFIVSQQQTCTSEAKGRNTPTGSFPGPFVDGDNVTTCTMNVSNPDGSSVDVSRMNDLYLKMDVTTGTIDSFATNDPAKSNRLFIDGKQVAKNQIVNIFTAVPCGSKDPSSQAWEDGGTEEAKMTLKDADFFYKVSGKCDFNQRPSVTNLTQ